MFAINKLDAVDDPAQAYEAVRTALLGFAEDAKMEVAGIVPVSALRGDNVTQPLDAPWYQGPSLLQLLESLPTAQERTVGDLLIPVQYVARDDGQTKSGGTGDQPRTLWGRIAHGRVQAGDEVQLFPSGRRRSSPRCAWPASWSTAPRPASPPASSSTASSMSRAATGSPHPTR